MIVLKQVLLKIWQGHPLSGDDLVALTLLLAMIASLSHLITMLVTRWGDRHIAAKSLLASVMVHLVCLLGLEVFDPLDQSQAIASTEVHTPERVVPVITLQSEDTINLPNAGNSPVPDRPLPTEWDLLRSPEPSRQMQTPDTPDRQHEVLDSLNTRAPDVSNFKKSLEPETAAPLDSAAEGMRTPGASDPAADISTMLQQSQADVYVPNTERVQTQTGDTSNKTSPERQMSSGSVSRIDTTPVTEDTSQTARTSNLPNAIPLPSGKMDDTLEKKAAPISGYDPSKIAGLDPEQPRERTMPARSFESRLPRPSRTMPSANSGEHPVRENSLTPQTPIPLSTDYDGVRVGMPSMMLTDALDSAARMVDPDTHSIRRRDSRQATYQLRDPEIRRDAAERFGGTIESEEAVELSLKWLHEMQSPDGHWDAETFGAGQVRVDENGVPRNYAGRDADTGLTALVTLSFLGAGYTHERGRYALTIDKALNWLIQQQDNEGSLAGEAGHYARMYCHAMATYTLAEALGMQDRTILGPIIDPEVFVTGPLTIHAISSALMTQQGLLPLMTAASVNATTSTNADLTAYGLRLTDELSLRSAVIKAVTFTISQQDPNSGGWRYKFGQEGDVSMFGWQMMSLKSAEIAGVGINPVVRDRMIQFLNSVRQGEHGGLFGYRRSVNIDGRGSEPVTPVMTAEALFCQQMLGYPRDSPASREAVQYLLNNLPRLSELNMYYWYYGTLAMYQYGGEPWMQWNAAVRDTLISAQRRDGRYAGSWDPDDPWGRYGGRLYSTAISTLTLEVYYRLLPLYRMNETPANK